MDFPNSRWPWNSSFDGRHASQGIFEPKPDGSLGWEPGIVTSRLQRSNLERSISRVILNADEHRAVERVDFVQTRFGV